MGSYSQRAVFEQMGTTDCRSLPCKRLGLIDKYLRLILAYRLQGTPLRGHGLLQSAHSSIDVGGA